MRTHELKNLISKLPVEKRDRVSKLLEDANMAINSAECELHGTEMEGNSLLVSEKHLTLWCQLYHLEKLFKQIE